MKNNIDLNKEENFYNFHLSIAIHFSNDIQLQNLKQLTQRKKKKKIIQSKWCKYINKGGGGGG